MEPAISSASSHPRHPAKVRQSCDNCGIFKLRCSRQHPRCHFCLERGLTCLYTPSRRPAKPSAVPSDGRARSYIENSAHSSQSRAQYTTAAESSSSWTGAVTDTRTGEDDKSDFGMKAIEKSSLGFPADIDTQAQGTFGQKPPATSGFEYNPKNDIEFNAIYGSLTPSALLAQDQGTFGQESPAVPGFEYVPNNDIGFNAIYGSLTPSVLPSCMSEEISDAFLKLDAVLLTENTDEFSSGMGDHVSTLCSPAPDYQEGVRNPYIHLKDIRPCTLHKRSCMVSALKILQALHMPPSVCLSAGATTSDTSSSQPRMTDCVLFTNREAVRLILDMLQCACSSSSQVQLVLTIICGKIVAWCRAVVRNGFENSSVMWSAIDKHNVSYEDHTERVLHQPITVGEYSINVKLEYKIRAQVVFDELQRVEALTKILSQRVKETKFGEHWNVSAARRGNGQTSSSWSVKSDGTGLGEVVHRALTVFLCKQLQVAKEEITALIQSGHGSTCVSGNTSDMDG